MTRSSTAQPVVVILVVALVSVFFALSASPSGTTAQEAPAAREQDPLLAVVDADPLELSRVVARLGDDAVLARLAADAPPDVCLAALRATPWLSAPEDALALLADHARGRDPDLAPAAALSALRVTDRLSADALTRREADAAVIRAAIDAFGALGRDESARRDLRRAGFEIARRLGSFLDFGRSP
jgi:hypothetical protein